MRLRYAMLIATLSLFAASGAMAEPYHHHHRHHAPPHHHHHHM
jgi:hypothetical protein